MLQKKTQNNKTIGAPIGWKYRVEITHYVLKIKSLGVLQKGVIASPISSQRGTRAGKGGMSWHRHISVRERK